MLLSCEKRILIHSFIFCVCLECVCAHLAPLSLHVPRQAYGSQRIIAGIGVLLLPCRSQGSNSGH